LRPGAGGLFLKKTTNTSNKSGRDWGSGNIKFRTGDTWVRGIEGTHPNKENVKMLTMHYKTLGKFQIECTYPKFSKSLIDGIDSFLAKHFALSMEELDFLVNYDFKYRLGAGDAEDDDGV
jgi:hypothetical protein